MIERAYLTAAQALSYASARALNGFEGHQSEAVQGALLRASDEIDASFVFSGRLVSIGQSRAWPRVGARDQYGHEISGIPEAIRRGVVELAIAYLTSEADAEILLGQRGHIQREKIGDIAVSYQNSPASRRARLHHLLQPLLLPAGHTRITRT